MIIFHRKSSKSRRSLFGGSGAGLWLINQVITFSAHKNSGCSSSYLRVLSRSPSPSFLLSGLPLVETASLCLEVWLMMSRWWKDNRARNALGSVHIDHSADRDECILITANSEHPIKSAVLEMFSPRRLAITIWPLSKSLRPSFGLSIWSASNASTSRAACSLVV